MQGQPRVPPQSSNARLGVLSEGSSDSLQATRLSFWDVWRFSDGYKSGPTSRVWNCLVIVACLPLGTQTRLGGIEVAPGVVPEVWDASAHPSENGRDFLTRLRHFI